MKEQKNIINFLESMQKFRTFLYTQSTGISFAHMNTLMMIEQEKNVTAKKIVQFSHITNASCSAFIRKMKKLKYISTKENPNDSRSVMVSITKTGKQEIQRKKDEAIKIITPIFEKLSEQEQETFAKLFIKITNHI
jgi:DNA-binding MarR family transcriptional regulator